MTTTVSFWPDLLLKVVVPGCNDATGSGHRGGLRWPFARGPCQSCLPPAISEGDIWTTLMAQTLHLNCPHLSSLWPAYAAAPPHSPPTSAQLWTL